jgi:hypothetical protein
MVARVEEQAAVTRLDVPEAIARASCHLPGIQLAPAIEYQLGRNGSRTVLKTEESRRAIALPLSSGQARVGLSTSV